MQFIQSIDDVIFLILMVLALSLTVAGAVSSTINLAATIKRNKGE